MCDRSLRLWLGLSIAAMLTACGGGGGTGDSSGMSDDDASVGGNDRDGPSPDDGAPGDDGGSDGPVGDDGGSGDDGGTAPTDDGGTAPTDDGGSEDPCVGVSCGANATCDGSSGSAVCACDDGFQDQDDDGTCLPACASTTCHGHGSCDIVVGEATCACDEGWTGERCDACATGYAGASCDTCADGYERAGGSGACVPTCSGPRCFPTLTSCKEILAQVPSAESGVYRVAAGEVYCDMVTDGGGYTFLKATSVDPLSTVEAEAYCATKGMRLFVPRSRPHLTSALRVANDESYGGLATNEFLTILGIYPDQDGAACESKPLHYGSAGCAFHASDEGPFWVSDNTLFDDLKGDNSFENTSLVYSWLHGLSDWYYDAAPFDVSTSTFLCDVGDKLGNGECVRDGEDWLCTCNEHASGDLCWACAAGYQDNDHDGNCEPSCAQLTCDGSEVCLDASGTAACESLAGASCLDILTDDASAQSGTYVIDTDGAGPKLAVEVYCDMTTDGGGYTMLKLDLGTFRYTPAVEAACQEYGLHLIIPRTEAHLASILAVARDSSIGPSADPSQYTSIFGIYPNFAGATCDETPIQSGNAECAWHARDNGPFWVSDSNVSGANGDGQLDHSMWYSFFDGPTLTSTSDWSPGPWGRLVMCAAADK